MNGLSVGFELQVGEIRLTLPTRTWIANGAMILCEHAVTRRKIRNRRLGMEGVVVQRVCNVHDAMRRIDGDHRTVDRIWHRSIENPVPVWDPEGGGRGLIPTSLVR